MTTDIDTNIDTNIDTKNINPKKTPKQKILAFTKNLLLYGLMFAIIYSVINWWR